MTFHSILALVVLGVATQAPAQNPTEPTAALLVELLRVNTTNPPGNEAGIANLLAPRFRRSASTSTSTSCRHPTLGRHTSSLGCAVPGPSDPSSSPRMRTSSVLSLEALRQGTEMIFRTLVDVAGKH